MDLSNSVDTSLIVITRDQVPISSPVRVEDNCACPGDGFSLVHSESMMVEPTSYISLSLTTDTPIVITRDQVPISSPVQVEENCACPADGFSLVHSEQRPDHTVLYRLPALYTDTPAAGFHLVFNPQSEAGVVLINDYAFHLLDTFRQPQSLGDGVLSAGNPSGGLETALKFVKLNLLDPVGRYRVPHASAPQLLTAWLHITNDCNLLCPYCYVDKTPDKMEVKRGQEAVEAVFRSAVAHGFRGVKFKYAGGEATLNFRLVLILHDYARQLAYEYGLTLEGVMLSNGVAITNRMIQEMKERNIRLMISLDGVGEYHDSQRYFVNGRGSFDLIERTLDRLVAHDFTPSISITLSNRNLLGLPEVVEYVLKRDLPFKLNFYRENDCSVSFSDLNYRDEQIIAAMKAAFRVIEANLPSYSLLDTLVDLARLDTLHDRTCGVGQSYMVINQNGGVAKCHMELERTVADISMADPLQLIQQDRLGLQNISVNEKEGCRNCSWRYFCAGGCPALTYRVTGRYDLKSPNCHIYKAIFPEVLKLEALRLLKYSPSSV